MRKKILIVLGTRPEAVKMGPLVKELIKYPDLLITEVCVTAQHREMLDQVLELFKIIPDYDLNLMRSGQDLYDLSSRVLLGMRGVIRESQPDIVLVHGDTTTSCFAALAAFYQKIPVGHVEAGLRTGDIYSPWPEEINRQLTGRIAKYHYSPTSLSRENLLKEDILPENIIVTGNTVIDALKSMLSLLNDDKKLEQRIFEIILKCGYPLSFEEGELKFKRKIILVTGHRRENFGEGFVCICNALKRIANAHPELDIVYPVHLNPNVKTPVYALLSEVKNIFLIPPVDYLPFILLMGHAKIILTDSGGVQEEAPSLGVPVLVMRNTTERPEAVEAGTVKLVGTDPEVIVAEVENLLSNDTAYTRMARAQNPYGDGFASARIVEHILGLKNE